jgi:hypothetical protein
LTEGSAAQTRANAMTVLRIASEVYQNRMGNPNNKCDQDKDCVSGA